MNLPNILTIIRLFMVPVFAYLFYVDRAWAVGIFVLACITDVVDGLIARRFHLVTRIGAFLDPLADKLMQIMVLVCLYTSGQFPSYAFYTIFIKEFVMVAGSIYIYKENMTVKASVWGKLSTVITAIGVSAILIFNSMIVQYVQYIGIVIVAAALFALANYTVMFKNMKNEQNKA